MRSPTSSRSISTRPSFALPTARAPIATAPTDSAPTLSAPTAKPSVATARGLRGTRLDTSFFLFTRSRLTLRAQVHAANLAADRLRQLTHVLDLARVLVGRGHASDVLLQLLGERVGTGPARSQDHVSLDDGSPHRVALAHDRAFHHRGVLDQGALHLEGTDAVTRRDDHVVCSSHEPEVTLWVHVRPVAGDVPVAALAGLGGGGIAPVFPKEAYRALRPYANGDVPLGVGRQWLSFIVDDGDVHPR